MSELYSGAFFSVGIGVQDFGLMGNFTSVSGLSREYEYETYMEGGSNIPMYFFKGMVPQRLVLERGLVFQLDQFAAWMSLIDYGMHVRLAGYINLLSNTGSVIKTWIITDAYPVKYIGPELNSGKSELAVSRIELLYNGCT